MFIRAEMRACMTMLRGIVAPQMGMESGHQLCRPRRQSCRSTSVAASVLIRTGRLNLSPEDDMLLRRSYMGNPICNFSS